MHVFYTPDIQKTNELPEEEAQHCTRVLRLSIGDEITLTDGKGSFYKAEITAATNKRCLVAIKETIFQKPLWPCHLHIAMAPTKNMDRNESRTNGSKRFLSRQSNNHSKPVCRN